MSSRKTLCLVVIAVLAGLGTHAVAADGDDPTPHRNRSGLWGLGLEGGIHKLVEGEWDYSTAESFLGVVAHRGLDRHWSLTAALRYGHVRPGAAEPGDETGFPGSPTAPLYTTLVQPAVSIRHHLSPAARVTPILGFGLGLTSWKVTDQTGEDPGLFPGGAAIDGYDVDGNPVALKGTHLTLLFELGVDFELTRTLDLTVGGRYGILTGNDRDNVGLSAVWGPDHVDANTAQAVGFVGLTWWFGTDDLDGDGIPDSRDACPREPEDLDGYNDLDGCPDPDNDGDGLLDAEDQCPTRPEDWDGFEDEDGCPDPDNDGDGVFDGRDRCPDEPEDIDGWEDQDGCPDPDNDGDGVPDERDKCPHTPAGVPVDADGCRREPTPESTPAPDPTPTPIPDPGTGTSPAADVTAPADAGGTVGRAAGAGTVAAGAAAGATGATDPSGADGEVLAGVTFRPGSAELTSASLARLIELADRLAAEPDLRLEISGHTDATGDPEANRRLSQERAEAVRGSLIALGVAPGRLTAVGYGADRPRADNDTAEGRARNRRVEVHELR